MKINIEKFQKNLKIKFKNKSLLYAALTHKSADQDINNESEDSPNLFSDDLEINLNNQTENPNEKVNVEEKELEMFENQDSEEDFEIPAFLRRQKN